MDGPFVLELKLWKSLFPLRMSLFPLHSYELACKTKLVTTLLISPCKIKTKKPNQNTKKKQVLYLSCHCC